MKMEGNWFQVGDIYTVTVKTEVTVERILRDLEMLEEGEVYVTETDIVFDITKTDPILGLYMSADIKPPKNNLADLLLMRNRPEKRWSLFKRFDV